jgi:hypothetical protein
MNTDGNATHTGTVYDTSGLYINPFHWEIDDGVEQRPLADFRSTPAITAYDIVYEGSYFLPKTQLLYFHRGSDPLVVMISRTNPLDRSPEWCDPRITEEVAEEQQGLEICQTLIQSLPFGRASSAYLVRGAGGLWRCVPGTKELGIFFDDPRAIPTADVKEVRLTRLAEPDRHEGVWNGAEVDVWRPRPGCSAGRENAARLLWASRMLGSLPYSFKVLAILTMDGDGVGLLFEPGNGRPLTPNDRAVVYEAFADLERHGLIFTQIRERELAIGHDGVLKLLNLEHLRLCPPDPMVRDDEMRHWHWDPLRDLFERLRLCHRDGLRLKRLWLHIARYHGTLSTFLCRHRLLWNSTGRSIRVCWSRHLPC